ncbi:hypothetical protein [Flavobacterium sp.]|uniref:hypothetical protein n=1 Tax=Flavobacterium sp. TaxID=239 RepID=UPI0039E37F92
MQRKFIKVILIISIVILAVLYFYMKFSHGWGFTNPIYINIFSSAFQCSMVGAIFSSFILKIPKITRILLPVMILAWGYIFYIEFGSEKLKKYPQDIAVIKVSGNQKTIIVKKQDSNTKEIYLDTIVAIDKFIFRKIIVQTAHNSAFAQSARFR